MTKCKAPLSGEESGPLGDRFPARAVLHPGHRAFALADQAFALPSCPPRAVIRFPVLFCMLPRDTHPAAHRVQLAACRALTLEQRAELVADLTRVARGLAREGIRLRHPGYTEEQVHQALLRLLYGPDLDRLTRAP